MTLLMRRVHKRDSEYRLFGCKPPNSIARESYRLRAQP